MESSPNDGIVVPYKIKCIFITFYTHTHTHTGITAFLVVNRIYLLFLFVLQQNVTSLF